MAHSTRRHRRASNLLLWTLSMPATLLTFAGFAGTWSWLFDLTSHFRLQYAVVLAAITAALFLTNRWKRGSVCAIALITNLGVIAPLYWPLKQTFFFADKPPVNVTSDTDPVNNTPLTLLFFNVNTANTNYEQVAQYLQESNADIIVVSETNQNWADALKWYMPASLFVAENIREDHFGMMMIVSPILRMNQRWQTAQILKMVDSLKIPAIEANLQWPTTNARATPSIPNARNAPNDPNPSSAQNDKTDRMIPIRILAIHTLPPMRSDYAYLRNQQLQAATEWVQQHEQPAIIIGDFNTTPWSHVFATMLKRGSLVNSQVGYGIAGTWPAHGGPLGMIPIDHCLHTAHWTVIDRRLGPSLGSDHRPLFVRLILDSTAE